MYDFLYLLNMLCDLLFAVCCGLPLILFSCSQKLPDISHSDNNAWYGSQNKVSATFVLGPVCAWLNLHHGPMCLWLNASSAQCVHGLICSIAQCVCGSMRPRPIVCITQCAPWPYVSVAQCSHGSMCPRSGVPKRLTPAVLT